MQTLHSYAKRSRFPRKRLDILDGAPRHATQTGQGARQRAASRTASVSKPRFSGHSAENARTPSVGCELARRLQTTVTTRARPRHNRPLVPRAGASSPWRDRSRACGHGAGGPCAAQARRRPAGAYTGTSSARTAGRPTPRRAERISLTPGGGSVTVCRSSGGNRSAFITRRVVGCGRRLQPGRRLRATGCRRCGVLGLGRGGAEGVEFLGGLWFCLGT